MDKCTSKHIFISYSELQVIYSPKKDPIHLLMNTDYVNLKGCIPLRWILIIFVSYHMFFQIIELCVGIITKIAATFDPPS